MSQEPLAVVRRIYELLEREGLTERGLELLVEEELADPDAEIYLRSADSGRGAPIGLPDLAGFLRAVSPDVEVRLEPESFRAEGENRVLVYLRVRIGNDEARSAHIVTVRNGRGVRLESVVARVGDGQ
jgi:hypothetical protein